MEAGLRDCCRSGKLPAHFDVDPADRISQNRQSRIFLMYLFATSADIFLQILIQRVSNDGPS
jgi:hypothetical protein